MRIVKLDDPNSERRIFSPQKLLGKVIRAPLRMLPGRTAIPVLQGPGRGLRWIVGSYNHSCWLGFYEYEKQMVLPKIVARGDSVYDVGAHVGYFSLIFSRLVGPRGTVYAFEPFERNFSYLCRHVALNGLTNVVAIQAGICASSGTAHFDDSDHNARGHRTDHGRFTFPVYNLVEYISQHRLRPPTLIKMDIEGEEASVVPSILEYVVANKTTLLISTHSDAVTEPLVTLLTGEGYSVAPLQWLRLPAKRLPTNASLLLARI
jgi:FkbM family methyltransferase